MSTYYRHRGSIFWALILIGVGVLFLLQNFNPSIRPWHVVAKYWPLLIIFWGVSKLVRYFQDRAHPEQAPVSLFSAGDAILLILVLVFGTLASKVILTPWHEWPSALGMQDEEFANLFLNSYTFTRRVSQPVKVSPRLLVVNRRGNIEVRGADQPEIGVILQETIWAENEAAAKRISDRLQVHFLESGGQYELVSNLDSLPHGGRNVRLDLQIQAPKATTTQLTDNKGDIAVSDLQGDQTLTARRGDVRVANVEGSVRIHESGGSMEIRDVQGSVQVEGRGNDMAVKNVNGTVTIDGNFSGAMRFEKIAQLLQYNSSRTNMSVRKLPGHLTMDMGTLSARGIEGPLVLDTSDKDINLEDFTYDMKVRDTNGDVHLRTTTAPTRPIEVDLKKGDISLWLPPASNFQIDAASRNGDVRSDFPGLAISRRQDLPSIKGVHGKGGPLIRLSSTYGTIRVMSGGS